MKQVFSTSEGIKVIEVPAPLLEKGSMLVEVSYSFISSGTEMATLKEMEPKGFSDNLIQSKERLKKLVKFFNEKGIKKTISIISQIITADETTSNRLVPIGYCCSGTIVAIGAIAVAEAVAVPEEIRGKIPGDFGRDRGIAWYYLGGFGIVHTQAAQSRIVIWDSAA